MQVNMCAVVEASSQQQMNYARLACLVMQEGTDRVRRAVLANLPQPALGFRHNIAQCRSKMESLRDKKIINSLQFETLYPASGCSVSLGAVDMTLLVVIARNVCNGGKKINWNTYPSRRQTKWQHDVLRIKEMRNSLFHSSLPELDDDTFKYKWQELVDTLKRLGSEDEVLVSYESRDLDPLETRRSTIKVKEQVLEELQGIIQTEKHTSHLLKLGAIMASLMCIVVLCSTVTPLIIVLTKTRPCEYNVITKATKYHQGIFKYMERHGWHAKKEKYDEKLKLPVNIVIIGQTDLIGTCHTSTECCAELQNFQQKAFANHLPDVPFNYLVGGDGVIYEGTHVGSQSNLLSKNHTALNNKSITIGIIGRGFTPPQWLLTRIRLFLVYLQDENHLILNTTYDLYAQCQFEWRWLPSPEYEFLKEIMTWKHFKDKPMGFCPNSTHAGIK